MHASYNGAKTYTKKDINAILTTIQQDKKWSDKHKFQRAVIENAFQRLSKRLIGWMMHRKMWRDDDDTGFEVAFDEFEEKHFTAYKRWRKVSKAKGGFRPKDSSREDVQVRVERLFVYYLVYGEVHDFRNMKGCLHLFFHVAIEMIEGASSEFGAGEWIREQGRKLYKILALAYNKDEMNRFSFHHDDLDDLCTTSSWVNKRFLENGKDFPKAFGLGEGQTKFPAMKKLLSLDIEKFIKYWQKSFQSQLGHEERLEREEWMSDNYLSFLKDKDSEELRKLEEELPLVRENLAKAKQIMDKRISKQAEHTERGKPIEKDFQTPDERQLFKRAFTQFETSKELLQTGEYVEREGIDFVKDAQVKHFRNKQESFRAYANAERKFVESNNKYAECSTGFRNALDGFKQLKNCQAYVLESNLYLSKTEWKELVSREKQLSAQRSRIIQHGFEDAINEDRSKFAKKWKTFYEAAGGVLGFSGYLTIFKHYSSVVYFHLFLLFPLTWFYVDYHNKIKLDDIAGSFQELIAVDGLMDPQNNILLMAGVTIALIVLALFLCFFMGFRTKGGTSSPRRDKGYPTHFGFSARFQCFLLWLFVLISEIAFMKYLVLDPLRTATENFIDEFNDNIAKNLILLLIHWIPVAVLFFSSIQYIFTLWVGIFGWIYGLIDGVNTVHTWQQLVTSFYVEGDERDPETKLPRVVEMFHKTVVGTNIEDYEGESAKSRKMVAFARVWNEVINYFYEIHKISKEELQRFSYQIKGSDEKKDFLSGKIEQIPDLKDEPRVEEVKYHLIKFVNNIMMKNKPKECLFVSEMVPLTVLTPVGNEKIIYPYEYITHVDNTQSSFLLHLIQKVPFEWENFKKREATTEKSKDFIERLEKDILQGLQPDQSKKRWIHNHKDGIALKLKICEWGSLRFQALYRTIYGFMHLPVALQMLARIQNPTMTQAEAEELVKLKFSYVVGYQSFGQFYRTYKNSKDKISEGGTLDAKEMEAHDAVYNIKYIKEKFPSIRIVYPDYDNGKYIGRLTSGVDPTTGNYFDYEIELFGPFIDMGLGKPTHQNFLSQFIDGLVVQTIDVNQDSVLPQSFFVTNILGELDRNPNVKIIGCPEFVITTNWSPTAWCSAFTEHTFGTLVQRTYARTGIRLHYGHPDFHDALWVMTETGLSKMTYVSEDIFTGFDTVLKGGKIIHAEYHEVGKARDVDLYTTTKFIRKISMGGSQMACSRYIQQLQSSSSTSYFQRLSFFYSTVGFYFNHLTLYLSIWFAMIAQLLLIIIDKYILENDISDFMVERVFSFQVGFALLAPGVLQLVLEYGWIAGVWKYLSHFLILAIYSTFHILNTSSYWQWGLTKTAFYLASGRGSGLEHYFMKDMYRTFYHTHWRAGFLILWIGVISLILSGNFLLFLFMYLLPAAIWLWGAVFLNPGALPSTVHEEQWKRLINRDMEQVKEIVREHSKLDEYVPPKQGFFLFRFFKRLYKSIHWVYTSINFAVHTRVMRLIAVIVIVYGLVFTSRIPTHIFTDERRRVLRWDEEPGRQQSIFYSNMVKTKESNGPVVNSEGKKVSKRLSRTARVSGGEEKKGKKITFGESSPVENLKVPPPRPPRGSKPKSSLKDVKKDL